MRAVAALSVLIYHFSIQFNAAGGSNNHWFYYLFNQIGYAGVDFFFVISGYIMWVTTQEKQNKLPALNFAYKRATRIFFGYWPYFLLAVIIITFFPSLISSNTNLTGSFFLTELETSKLLIQVAWTLQYELYFYGLFTMLLFIDKKHVLKAIGSLVFLILVYQFYIQLQPNENLLKPNSDLFNFMFSPFCLQFFTGCLLGHYFQTKRLNHLPLILLTGLAILISAIYLQESVLYTSLISINHLNLRVVIFGSSAVLLLAVIIECEMRGRILLKKISTVLGGASYSIYLSHTLVISLVFVLGWQNWMLLNSESPGLWIFLLMILTVFYSIMHYKWIEQPLMSIARKLGKYLFKNVN